jgi:FkbM family methyltransferase
VGCNHPIEYNNTYLLYLKGWRGINIDANKNLIELNKKYRNEDINLNYLISDREEAVRFYLASNDKLSSLHKEHLDLVGEDISDASSYALMQTQTLNNLLKEYIPSRADKLDLLCVDVEGHEFQVLQSIDLDKYQPQVIVIELHDFELHNPTSHRVYCLLNQKGYRMHHFVFSNAFFIRESR